MTELKKKELKSNNNYYYISKIDDEKESDNCDNISLSSGNYFKEKKYFKNKSNMKDGSTEDSIQKQIHNSQFSGSYDTNSVVRYANSCFSNDQNSIINTNDNSSNDYLVSIDNDDYSDQYYGFNASGSLENRQRGFLRLDSLNDEMWLFDEYESSIEQIRSSTSTNNDFDKMNLENKNTLENVVEENNKEVIKEKAIEEIEKKQDEYRKQRFEKKL